MQKYKLLIFVFAGLHAILSRLLWILSSLSSNEVWVNMSSDGWVWNRLLIWCGLSSHTFATFFGVVQGCRWPILRFPRFFRGHTNIRLIRRQSNRHCCVLRTSMAWACMNAWNNEDSQNVTSSMLYGRLCAECTATCKGNAFRFFYLIWHEKWPQIDFNAECTHTAADVDATHV